MSTLRWVNTSVTLLSMPENGTSPWGAPFVLLKLTYPKSNGSRIIQLSYLPPVMVGLVDEEEDLVLLHEDPLAVLGDVLKVEGHVDEDLVRVQGPVAVLSLSVEVTVVVMPNPVMVVEVQSW